MSVRTRRYEACGLTIAADAPIGGLALAGSDDADVSVALHDGDPVPAAGPSDRAWYSSPYRDAADAPVLVASQAPDGSRWLRYSEGAVFRVDREGRQVDAWWGAPLTSVDVATYLLGPVLAFVLRLRDRVPLHASAVAVDGRAVLFAGDAGAGKSTTAAALATLGYPLVSDDIVPVTDSERGPVAWPAYPRVSLCADAAEALFSNGVELPPFSATYQKRYLDLDDAGLPYERSPLPVGLIVVLDGAAGHEASAIRPLGPRAGLMALLRHTYGTYLIDRDMRAREFDLLARIARSVPVWEARFGGGLGDITAQCAALVERLRERSYASEA